MTRTTENARYAALASWANTVDRTARTAKARRNSPSGIEYWLDRLPSTFDTATEQQRLAAATLARRVHFIAMSRKAHAAKAAKRMAS